MLYLEFVADDWVIVDDLGDGADEADDLLGDVVARRRLAANHDGAGHAWRARVRLYVVVPATQRYQPVTFPNYILANKNSYLC